MKIENEHTFKRNENLKTGKILTEFKLQVPNVLCINFTIRGFAWSRSGYFFIKP